MVQILGYTEGKLIAAKATRKLTETDYYKLLPLLIHRLKQYSTIRLYFEMDEFEGWEITSFWEDVKFEVRHATAFDKVAMLGGKLGQSMSDLINPFTAAEVRYFLSTQKEEAMNWIKGE